MQFTSISLATLAAIASSIVAADSATFGIMNTRTGTEFQYSSWGVASDGKVVIESLTSGAASLDDVRITTDTAVLASDGRYLVVNSDYSISLGDESSATTGFSVGPQEGVLVPFQLNGSNGFIVCPSEAGEYILYSQTPEGASGCTGLSSWAVFTESPSSSSSPSSSTTQNSSIIPTSTYHNTTTPDFHTTTKKQTSLTTQIYTSTTCEDDKCHSKTEAPDSTSHSVIPFVGGAENVAASSITAFGALVFALLF